MPFLNCAQGSRRSDWAREASSSEDTNGFRCPQEETAPPRSWIRVVRPPRKAAEQGYAEAQFFLGLMYATGEGVIKDFVQAHAWCNVAGANGDETAYKSRDLAAKLLTPEQLAEATKLAREYFGKYKAPSA